MPATDGGLGEHIVGDKVVVGKRNIVINSLLDEGKTKLRDLLHPCLSIVSQDFGAWSFLAEYLKVVSRMFIWQIPRMRMETRSHKYVSK